MARLECSIIHERESVYVCFFKCTSPFYNVYVVVVVVVVSINYVYVCVCDKCETSVERAYPSAIFGRIVTAKPKPYIYII